MRAVLRVLGVGLKWLLHVVLPFVAAVGGFFGGAKLIASTAGLVILALLASTLVAYAIARFLLRAPRFAPIPVVVVIAVGWLVLFRRPPVVTRSMPARAVPFALVKLSTGSSVAVARIPGTNVTNKTPLVFLHGGPGGYVRDDDLALLKLIAAGGVDVVAFDQAGGGSPRLPPHEHSIARAVADLEALRVSLGAEKLSLFGHSWGSMLAYEYAAAHGDRVERMILSGAGLLSSRAKEFAIAKTALPNGKQVAFPTYFMSAVLLHRLNPDAAFSFLPRDELDFAAKTGAMANLGRWFCKADAGKIEATRAQWDAMPSVDAAQAMVLKRELEQRAEAPPALAKPPPTLIVRGLCDFVPWQATLDLRDRTRGAVVVTIPDVGHAIWPARAELMRDLVLGRLDAKPLALPSYTGNTDPAG